MDEKNFSCQPKKQWHDHVESKVDHLKLATILRIQIKEHTFFPGNYALPSFTKHQRKVTAASSPISQS